MSLRESAVFVESSIADVVGRLDSRIRSETIRLDGETAVLFGGKTLQTALFAIRSEDEAPLDRWTQILHRKPDDVEALAKALAILQIDPESIRISTDWEGNALLPADALRSTLREIRAARRRIPVQPRRSFFNQPEMREEKGWVIIDAAGMPLGRLATMAAYRLASKAAMRTSEKTDRFKVVIVNATKVQFFGAKYRQRSKTYLERATDRGAASPTHRERYAREGSERGYTERVIEKAVERMLPKNAQRHQVLKNLKVYRGSKPKSGLEPAERWSEDDFERLGSHHGGHVPQWNRQA